MYTTALSRDDDLDFEPYIDEPGESEPYFADIAPFLAHETMNIVMGMRGVSMLLAEADPDGASDRMEQLAERVERLGRHLGEYARADAFNLSEIDPFLILTDAVAAIAAERGAFVDVGCGHGSHLAMGDEGSLRLALTYLIRHLVRRAPLQTSVQVSIFMTLDENGERVVFKVSAAGCPDHVADPMSLFEPFRARLGDESGLELPIAQRVARAHGGETTARRIGDRLVLTLAIPAGMVAR